MQDVLVYQLEDIEPGFTYRLKIGDYSVRDLTYGSFQSRKASLVQTWIGAQLLYKVIEEELYHQEKPKKKVYGN